MKSTIKKLLAIFVAVSGLSSLTFEAQATPAFARQMQMNCMGCHSQNVPMLNGFGRIFKLSGFTMTSGKPMIAGGDLGMSLPLAINAGAAVKSNMTNTDQPGGRGQFSIPAGASLFVGGQVAENMGATSLWNGDGMIHFQGTYSKPIGAARAGLSLYGSQGHGAFLGVESQNTGLHKELAMFNNNKRANAVQAVGFGLGNGPTSGILAFYANSGFKVAAGMRVLGFNSIYTNGGLDTDGDFGSLYRLTYDIPTFAGWNVTVGTFGVSGTTTATTSKVYENIPAKFSGQPWFNLVNNHEVTSDGFDLQAEGSIAGMNTQIILSIVSDYEFQLRNETDTMTMIDIDSSANSLEFQIMPTSAWGLRVGIMNFSNNLNSSLDFSTLSFGVNYNYTDNVLFSVEQSQIDNETAEDYSETLLQALIAF